MRLTHLSISDYRSISKASFSDLPNVTTLIGANNEGKSNILEGLRICLELLRSDRIMGSGPKVRIRPITPQYDWEEDYPVKKQVKNPDGASVFHLEFQLTDEEAQRFQEKVRSKLNGRLPIELRFSTTSFVEFRVVKPGPGASALSKKAATICEFIAQNLDFAHVPAIRTAETSQDLVKDLVARELRILERKPEYAQLQASLEALQQPVLASIAAKVKTNLDEILGASLKKVTITLPRRTQIRALARAAEIAIDDGVATSLDRKGDGVKSLVAIGLLTKALQESESAKDVILLIEEPESHLHPKAIHQLKEVIDNLKQDRQIIITTHCPILVNRSQVPSNIIVSKNKASPAKKLEELREVLGVSASDNLRHALLVMVVEGQADEVALRAVFEKKSTVLRQALTDGRLAFESIGGASKLPYSLNLLQTVMCNYFALLDDDDEGRAAAKSAGVLNLLSISNHSLTKCRGMLDAEFEDLLNENVYAGYFKSKYAVDVTNSPFNQKGKWSERIRVGLTRSGKNWTQGDEDADKAAVANLVAANPLAAIHIERMPMVDALITAVEQHLESLVG